MLFYAVCYLFSSHQLIFPLLPSGSASVVRYDPSLPRHLAAREIRSLNRKSLGLDRAGKAKRAMTDKEKKALEKKLSTLDQLGVIPAKENIEDQDHLDCEPSLLPIKKRRISQDQRLALSMIGMNGNDGNDDSSRRTRRRLN
jgi:hypothetical protein